MISMVKPNLTKEEINGVVKVLKSGMLAQWRGVAEFEEKFAKFCGSKYGVAVNSGTAALHVALYACGIKPGDEVITTPFTFVATANSVLMQGAKPVFVDIDPVTFNIDPEKIEAKITKKTKAILPIDLFGHVYDVGPVNKLARKHNLKIIEDACQAVGAKLGKRKAGSFGDAGCFSFYATKNMITGEGGMMVTNSKKMADLAKMFRHHGQSEKVRYTYHDLGFNYRMTEIAAAIGLVQLKKIERLNQKRIRNGQRLSQKLKGIEGIITPQIKEGYKHVFHQYTIRVTDKFKLKRDQLMEWLSKKEIGSAIFYPKPLHLQPHLAKFGYQSGDFPVTEQVAGEVLSLPVQPNVSLKEVDYIAEVIRKANQ